MVLRGMQGGMGEALTVLVEGADKSIVVSWGLWEGVKECLFEGSNEAGSEEMAKGTSERGFGLSGGDEIVSLEGGEFGCLDVAEQGLVGEQGEGEGVKVWCGGQFGW